MSTSAAPPAELTPEQASATMRQRQYGVLLVLAAIVGLVVSLAAWGFLELVHQIQQEVFTHLPHALGYNNGPPAWWLLLVLTIGGVIVAFAIVRLPGTGGHIPAGGLSTGGPPVTGIQLPGIVLAALGTLGLGLILGPEAPLIALGAGLGTVAIKQLRKDAPSQVVMVVAATGSFAAMSMVFGSPVIAAVVLIEATGLGGARLPVVLLPGLLGAGIGSLVSTGMGSFTGLSTSAYALAPLQLPHLARPTAAEFGWTIGLAVVAAVLTQVAVQMGLSVNRIKWPRFLLLPLVGLIVAGLAIAFTHATDKSYQEVLFSGQDQLPGLVSQAGTWSLAALTWLILFKGIGFGLCLGSFRGGPTFPALYLGAAGGIMASHLAGFSVTAAVAAGMAATTTSMLRLPLTGVVVATFLTLQSGIGAGPLIIVAAVVSYLVTLLVSAASSRAKASSVGAAAAANQGAPVQAPG